MRCEGIAQGSAVDLPTARGEATLSVERGRASASGVVSCCLGDRIRVALSLCSPEARSAGAVA
eukprot:1529786-Alexandrium_andersonii.AAC.1